MRAVKAQASAVPGRMIARAELEPGRRSAASLRGRYPGEGASRVEPDGCRRGARREEPGTSSKPGTGSTASSGMELASIREAPPSGAGLPAAGPDFQRPRPAAAWSNSWPATRPGPSPSRAEEAFWAPDSGVPGPASTPRARGSRPGFPPGVWDARSPRSDRCSNRSESECRRRTGPKRRPGRC